MIKRKQQELTKKLLSLLTNDHYILTKPGQQARYSRLIAVQFKNGKFDRTTHQGDVYHRDNIGRLLPFALDT